MQPLAGRHLVITRPAEQAGLLQRLLTQAGAEVTALPLIAIQAPADPAPLMAAIEQLDQFQLAIFVSPSAIDAVASRLTAPWPKETQIAVIGPGSARRAEELGLPVALQPSSQFDSEGLLALPELQDMHGQQVVVFRGNGGRELLPDTLIQRGARVDRIESYQRSQPTLDAERLTQLSLHAPDGWILTSSEALDNLIDQLSAHQLEAIQQHHWFASHPNIARHLQQKGFVRVIDTGSGDAAILASLAAHFASQSATPGLGDLPRPRFEESIVTAATTASAAATERPRNLLGPWIGASIALLLVLGLYLDQGHRLSRLRDLLDSRNTVTPEQVDQLRQRLNQADSRLALAEAHLQDIRQQEEALGSLYRDLGLREEDRLLADAELTLRLTTEHLQLAGEPQSAISLLQGLADRLALHDLPRLALLRKALLLDIARLEAEPRLDMPLLSSRLDQLAQQVDTLPLQLEPAPPTPAPTGNTWQEKVVAWGKSLVELRRLDAPSASLLTPRETLLARQQLQLSLAATRLALIRHDAAGFSQAIRQSQQLLTRFFPADTTRPHLAMLAALEKTRFPSTTLSPSQSLTALSALTGASKRRP